jgi:hypothetical protein
MLTQENRIRLIHANRTALLDRFFDEFCQKLPGSSAEQVADDIVTSIQARFVGTNPTDEPITEDY